MGFEGSWRVGGVDGLRGLSTYSHRARLARPKERLFRAVRIRASDIHVVGSEFHNSRPPLLRWRLVVSRQRLRMIKGKGELDGLALSNSRYGWAN